MSPGGFRVRGCFLEGKTVRGGKRRTKGARGARIVERETVARLVTVHVRRPTKRASQPQPLDHPTALTPLRFSNAWFSHRATEFGNTSVSLNFVPRCLCVSTSSACGRRPGPVVGVPRLREGKISRSKNLDSRLRENDKCAPAGGGWATFFAGFP